MSKEVNEERAPRTVTDVKEMLTKHSNGEIQRTIQNCITILQNDHVLADAIRLNLLSERIDIVKPVGWPRSGKPLNDTDMKYTRPLWVGSRPFRQRSSVLLPQPEGPTTTMTSPGLTAKLISSSTGVSP